MLRSFILCSFSIAWLLFLFSGHTKAGEVYFSCLPVTRTVPFTGEFYVNVGYGLLNGSERLLKIKPSRTVEGAFILNSSDEWVSATDTWAKMPYISKRIKVKITGNSSRYFDLGCEVQDVLLGKVFTTKPVKMWGNSVWREYINTLNTGILRK
jgi:hypothetical protein